MGRFTTEDPVRSDLNWYTYCRNCPLIFIDPLGLFTAGDRLYAGGSNNIDDVKMLQRALNSLGGKYFCGAVDGIFGNDTLWAVNQYKNAIMPGGNTGSNNGIVGLQTWSSLGLPAEFKIISPIDDIGKFKRLVDGANSTKRPLSIQGFNPVMTSEAFYASFDSLSDLARFEYSNGKFSAGLGGNAGLVRISQDLQYLEWDVSCIDADARIGLEDNFIGGSLGVRLVGGKAVTAISIPYANKELVIGAEGEIGAFSMKAYWQNGRIKVGFSDIIGGGIIIGVR